MCRLVLPARLVAYYMRRTFSYCNTLDCNLSLRNILDAIPIELVNRTAYGYTYSSSPIPDPIADRSHDASRSAHQHTHSLTHTRRHKSPLSLKGVPSQLMAATPFFAHSPWCFGTHTHGSDPANPDRRGMAMLGSSRHEPRSVLYSDWSELA